MILSLFFGLLVLKLTLLVPLTIAQIVHKLNTNTNG
jgi:hypothetical protein